MKFVTAFVFALVFSALSFTAEARPGHGGGHGGRCAVHFQKCDFEIAGNCVKWNRKTYPIHWSERHYACRDAAYEYGHIRGCRVDCGRW